MRALLGALALIVLSAAVAARADVRVGVTAAVNPQAIGQPPTEPERMLLVGTDNFANEKVTTGPAGQVQLLFVDGSSISVGPDAALTIDQYVYDPVNKTGKLALRAAQGVFRLVGGAISKSSEVTITTPIATAGIRGGIAVIDARPNEPMTAAFLFGTSLRVTANGATQEVVRPGFQITVPPGQQPGPAVRITNAQVRNFYSQFLGRPRTGGGQGQGGQEAPQDQALAQSNVSSVTGSDQLPRNLGYGQFLGRALNPNTLTNLANVITEASREGITNQLAQNIPPPAPFQLFGHFYAGDIFVPGTFDTNSLADAPDPNGNAPMTFTVRGRRGNQAISFAAPTGNGQTQSFTLPFNPGASYPTGNITLPTGTANGTVMVSPDAQFFSVFGNFTPNNPGTGDNNNRFGFFGGVPTAALPTAGIATYAVNPIFASLPFVHGDQRPRPGAAGVASSPLFVAWSPVTNPAATRASDQRATLAHSSLYIVGSGANQQSGLFGVTGGFFQEQGSTVAMSAGLVGSSRDCATCVLTRTVSGVASAPIVTNAGNGNAIYGPNANYIVAVPDKLIAQPNAPDMRQTSAQLDVPFDTLTSQQQTNDRFFVGVATQNAANSAPTQGAASVSRTNQTLTGFLGGVMDVRAGTGTITTRQFTGSNVTIVTSADTNRMSATFVFSDLSENAYSLQFGSTSGFNGGRSAFINDMIFAARDQVDMTNAPTSTFNSATVGASHLFMVNSNLVPIDLQSFAGPGVTACTCSFMQWGWWIGELQNTSAANSNRERFHLATWVAGVMPQAVELPMSGTATFNGHAIGNVAATSVGNYVAAGNYQQTWDFGAHSGTASISNFDRGGPLGTVNVTGSISPAGGVRFSGGVFGGPVSGNVNGAFFKNVKTNDPIAGVGGSFSLNGAGYRVGGTFAGCRAGTSC